MMSSKKLRPSASAKILTPEEQQAKINDVRKIIGPYAQKLPVLCSDAAILRYLRARNWNTKKAAKMLKDTIKWRLAYKPEKIRWEHVAQEAETGKVYRASYCDKLGRTVLVMRPGFQNTSSTTGQIMYLVYCMENAIMNMSADQEQMVWLIDFQGWNASRISMNTTRETAHILQDHYPERLALAIFYSPPKIFESFWKMVKPFLESKTYKKVKFVYSDDPHSMKIMEDLFDMDRLESAFGGRNPVSFNFESYAKMMREDDLKMPNMVSSGCSSPGDQPSTGSESYQSQAADSDNASEASVESGNVSDGDKNCLNLEGGSNDKVQDQKSANIDIRHEAVKEGPVQEPPTEIEEGGLNVEVK